MTSLKHAPGAHRPHINSKCYDTVAMTTATSLDLGISLRNLTARDQKNKHVNQSLVMIIQNREVTYIKSEVRNQKAEFVHLSDDNSEP